MTRPLLGALAKLQVETANMGKIVQNLTDKALEGDFPYQQIRISLEFSDFFQRQGSWTVPQSFLYGTSGDQEGCNFHRRYRKCRDFFILCSFAIERQGLIWKKSLISHSATADRLFYSNHVFKTRPRLLMSACFHLFRQKTEEKIIIAQSKWRVGVQYVNFTDNFAVPQISSLLVAVIFSSSNRGSLLIALTSKLHFRIYSYHLQIHHFQKRCNFKMCTKYINLCFSQQKRLYKFE